MLMFVTAEDGTHFHETFKSVKSLAEAPQALSHGVEEVEIYPHH